ncbi:hypothetical protein, partial [Bilophila wadsworthia]
MTGSLVDVANRPGNHSGHSRTARGMRRLSAFEASRDDPAYTVPLRSKNHINGFVSSIITDIIKNIFYE